MIASGIKASELIKKLQEMIAKHGDQQCIAGGGDYPEGVHSVRREEEGDGYKPRGSFVIS